MLALFGGFVAAAQHPRQFAGEFLHHPSRVVQVVVGIRPKIFLQQRLAQSKSGQFEFLVGIFGIEPIFERLKRRRAVLLRFFAFFFGFFFLVFDFGINGFVEFLPIFSKVQVKFAHLLVILRINRPQGQIKLVVVAQLHPRHGPQRVGLAVGANGEALCPQKTTKSHHVSTQFGLALNEI